MVFLKLQERFQRWVYALAFFPVGTVIISWDANREPDLKGYKIYYGTSSRNYSQVIDVGNTTQYAINNLQENVPYYFAVTAYDTAGNESDFSEEVSVIFNGDNVSEPAQDVELSYNYPNPFAPKREVTRIRYVLNQPDKVTIEIYDAGNNRVRVLINEEIKLAGEHTEDIWDGRDESGRIVARGVYFCKIQTSQWTQYIKIAVTD